MARQIYKDQKAYDEAAEKLRSLRNEYSHGNLTPVETFEALLQHRYSPTMATRLIENWRKETKANWRQMTQYELENDVVIEYDETGHRVVLTSMA